MFCSIRPFICEYVCDSHGDGGGGGEGEANGIACMVKSFQAFAQFDMLNVDDVKHFSVDVNAIQTSLWSLLLNGGVVNGATMPMEFFCLSENKSESNKSVTTIGDVVEAVVIV